MQPTMWLGRHAAARTQSLAEILGNSPMALCVCDATRELISKLVVLLLSSRGSFCFATIMSLPVLSLGSVVYTCAIKCRAMRPE